MWFFLKYQAEFSESNNFPTFRGILSLISNFWPTPLEIPEVNLSPDRTNQMRVHITRRHSVYTTCPCIWQSARCGEPRDGSDRHFARQTRYAGCLLQLTTSCFSYFAERTGSITCTIPRRRVYNLRCKTRVSFCQYFIRLNEFGVWFVVCFPIVFTARECGRCRRRRWARGGSARCRRASSAATATTAATACGARPPSPPARTSKSSSTTSTPKVSRRNY